MRQVLRAGALGRPRGIGWRRRWEGGSGWGIHVNPWLIHVSVWQKLLQYYKVISLQLIKINEKKKAKNCFSETHSYFGFASLYISSSYVEFCIMFSKFSALLLFICFLCCFILGDISRQTLHLPDYWGKGEMLLFLALSNALFGASITLLSDVNEYNPSISYDV